MIILLPNFWIIVNFFCFYSRNFSKITELPLDKFSSFDFLRNDQSKKIIFCQSGARSKKALIKMKKQGIDNCYCLKEGAIELNAWEKLK